MKSQMQRCVFVMTALFALSPLAQPTQPNGKVAQPAKADEGGPWGKEVDGLVCRLMVAPRLTIGQPIEAIVEVKNVSAKKRYISKFVEPAYMEYTAITVIGPNGALRQTFTMIAEGQRVDWFQAIDTGEVKRTVVRDIRRYFLGPDTVPRDVLGKPNIVPIGKIEFRMRFKSPAIPTQLDSEAKRARFEDTPPEMFANQWSGEIEAASVFLELAPMGKDDLVIHEWGVFTVLNDQKYANADRNQEWGSLPPFFYRQFPKMRLHWAPSSWDKPIVYFYAKPTPLQMRVKVTFSEGAPVAWWPAANDPVDGRDVVQKPFRSLTWDTWVGNIAPQAVPGKENYSLPLGKVTDYPLPPECWLEDARLPTASRLSVIGTSLEGLKRPSYKFQTETESFLYYDGLVPAPDYLHCEQTDATSVTLRNGAKFDIARLFVVDRRTKGKTAFAFVDGVKQPFKAGTTLTIEPAVIVAKDWPAAGVKQMRQALLDAGLFEPEADSLIKIWQKRLLEADGLVAFHILPTSEYDRMLPLEILPPPAAEPVRVGIAFHPNLEIEPALRQRVGPLIRQLDDDKYEKRTAASKALLEIGPVAIGMLRAELSKEVSLEMRRRMEAVLDSVDATEWLKIPEQGKDKDKK